MASWAPPGSAATMRHNVRLAVHLTRFIARRRSGRWRNVLSVPPWNPVERRVAKYMNAPPTVRGAVSTIVVATLTVVVISGVLMRVLDHKEFDSVWLGMWWAIQTVTTVGYGDVTPKDVLGRVVAAAVMLQGIAFIAIITAVITSSFVARATRARDAAQAKDEMTELEQIEARLAELDRKLDRLQASLRGPTAS
jgi:voltage-gated potassium channel